MRIFDPSETVAVSATPHIEAVHTPSRSAESGAFARYVGYLN